MSVAVVVLNWNGCRDTIECLESLVAARPGPSRVVVVDNASSDDSVEQLIAWAARRGVEYAVVREGAAPPGGEPPWLTLLAARVNHGFSGGNNVGIAFLEPLRDGEHVLLLNNDAAVAPTFFGELADGLRAAPDAGLATGTIYEADRRDRVWYAGGVSKPLRALVLHAHAVPASAAPVETEFISGCAMLIPQRTLRAVGPLPECYNPAYWEDADYSFRVRAAGLRAIYVPRAVAYHKVGASMRRRVPSPRVIYWQMRNRAYYVRRNFVGRTRWAALGYLAVTKTARAGAELLRGRPRLAWAILSGTAVGFTSRAVRSGGRRAATPSVGS